jgi:CRP/FNR family transcriptional regulator
MNLGTLGRWYTDGECVFRQHDVGDDFFLLQQGQLVLTLSLDGREVTVAALQAGDIFGQLSLFHQAPRSTTARAVGQARVLTLSRSHFLRRIHEDPSLAFQTLRCLSEQLERLYATVHRLQPPAAH